MGEKILMRDDKAAKKVTVELWQSANGKLFDNEQAARYDGCTHTECDKCGGLAKKPYILCDKCRLERETENYNALPAKEWNEDETIYSETAEMYFADIDEVLEECELNNVSIEDLRLVFTENYKPQQLTADFFTDNFDDYVGEESIDELNNIIDEFNEQLAEIDFGIVPIKVRVIIPEKLLEEVNK